MHFQQTVFPIVKNLLQRRFSRRIVFMNFYKFTSGKICKGQYLISGCKLNKNLVYNCHDALAYDV